MLFRIVYLVIFILYIIIRLPHSKKYKKSEKAKRVRPGVENFLVFLNAMGMLLSLTFVILPTPDIFKIELPRWSIIASSAILFMSLFLFYMVHKSLGKNWSPILEIQKEHSLVTEGIYKYIRHPMYTQLWIWVLFQGLVLQNWLVEVYGITAWSLLYFMRVPAEEKMLLEKFGDKYKEYMSQTGRVFPKIFKQRAKK